jgi:hypothetical protein
MFHRILLGILAQLTLDGEPRLKNSKKICSGIAIALVSLMMIASNTHLVRAWAPGKVLIDARTAYWDYYGNYTGAIAILTSNGYTVDTLTSGTITSSLLSNYCCLVIVCGDQILPSEISPILTFVNGGGGLVFCAEWGGTAQGLTNSYAGSIASALGVTLNNDSLNDPTNYISPITNLVIIQNFPISHPVTSGVTEFVYGDGCTLSVTSPAMTLATGGPNAYTDPSVGAEPTSINGTGPDGPAPYAPVLAASTYGAGRAVITGDSDLFDSAPVWAGGAVVPGDGINRLDNAVLWLNIINWVSMSSVGNAVPEVPVGTIMASSAMILAFAAYLVIKPIGMFRRRAH